MYERLGEQETVPSELAMLASAAAEDQGETKIFIYLFKQMKIQAEATQAEQPLHVPAPAGTGGRTVKLPRAQNPEQRPEPCRCSTQQRSGTKPQVANSPGCSCQQPTGRV